MKKVCTIIGIIAIVGAALICVYNFVFPIEQYKIKKD